MDDYEDAGPTPMTAPGNGGGSLAKRIADIHPELQITARMDSYGGPLGNDTDYLKERHARIQKEISALQSELTNFDEKAAIEQIKKSLTADLAHKRADLMSCEADLDAAGVTYESGGDEAGAAEDVGEGESGSTPDESKDGETIATGNPYSVMNRGGKFVIENTETGKVKGTHATKQKAMRQFRLLEGIEHGWTPTKGK